jgi:hypothetical protein
MQQGLQHPRDFSVSLAVQVIRDLAGVTAMMRRQGLQQRSDIHDPSGFLFCALVDRNHAVS